MHSRSPVVESAARTETVSVAMCTYNGGRYLQEQLDSIVRQSRLPDEVVVADDGSTDETLSILERFVQSTGDDVRVRILSASAEPVGASQNFHRAMSATTGDIILLADQDDVWSPQRVSRAIEELCSDAKPLLFITNPDLIGPSGSALGRTQFDAMGLGEGRIDALNSSKAIDVACRANGLPGMAFALRRELLDRALPVPSLWMHDWYLVMWAAALGRLKVTAESGLVSHRLHETNTLAATPGFVTRVRRSLGRRGESAARVGKMSQVLDRFTEASGAVQSYAVQTVTEKRDFEVWRAGLPGSPASRAWQVLQSYRRGDYDDFASAGTMTALQDLVVPQHRLPAGQHDVRV